MLNAVTALADLMKEFPHGALMGGAVRDAQLGRPVRDYDYYIDYSYVGSVSDWVRRQPARRVSRIIDSDEPEYQHQYIQAREELVYDDGSMLDIILHQPGKDWREIVESFDIGLCMIAVSGTGLLMRTAQFNKDCENKTLTVYRSGWGEAGVEKHVARLLLKYPEYTVVRADQDGF